MYICIKTMTRFARHCLDLLFLVNIKSEDVNGAGIAGTDEPPAGEVETEGEDESVLGASPQFLQEVSVVSIVNPDDSALLAAGGQFVALGVQLQHRQIGLVGLDSRRPLLLVQNYVHVSHLFVRTAQDLHLSRCVHAAQSFRVPACLHVVHQFQIVEIVHEDLVVQYHHQSFYII